MKKDVKIAIVVGSRSDFKFFAPVLERLKDAGITFDFNIASAHRTPDRLRQWLKKVEQKGFDVIIAGAGGAAHLPGVVASLTLLPVIGVPLDTTHLRGVDALYSIVQMPRGVPVATVGINNVENAMLLALQILALKYPEVREYVQQYRNEWPQKIDDQMKALCEECPELWGSSRKITAQKEKKTPDDHKALFHQTDQKILQDLELDFQEFSQKVKTAQDDHPESRQQAEQKKKRTPKANMPKDQKSKSDENKRIQVPLVHVEKKPLILQVNAETPEPEIIEEAAVTLLDGGIVAMPTDTVYGIGVDATNAMAVQRLYEVKKRDESKALPLLIHTINQLNSLVKEVPAHIQPLIEQCWPGALTIVFRKYKNTFTAVSRDTTIGVRIPDNMICLSLLSMMARPMAATSANISGHPPATSAEQVEKYFGDQVDLILDGGPAVSEAISTVLSVVSEPFVILREGGIARDLFESILGKDGIK